MVDFIIILEKRKMTALSSQNFIDSFYQNRKINPKNNFPLLNKEWKKVTDHLETKTVYVLISFTLLGAVAGFIATSIFKSSPIPLTYAALTLVGAGTGFIFSLIVSLVYVLLKSDNHEAFNFYENGVPKSLVYSLRSWINSRYEMNISNAETVSLLTNARTPLRGDRYKLVYSSDNDYILDLVVDNSCPSGCCDADSIDESNLEENNVTFKI